MKAIAAVDRNFGIGSGNGLLFHIPDDKRFFRNNTLNKVVVMGRKTLLSLPGSKPFKDRANIVLTRDLSFNVPGVKICRSIPALMEELKNYNSDDVYVAGGGEVYKELLQHCDTAMVTKINAERKADVFFPVIDKIPGWELSQESEWHSFDGISYKFCTYVKR